MAEAAREWNADVKDLGEKIVGLSLLQANSLTTSKKSTASKPLLVVQ